MTSSRRMRVASAGDGAEGGGLMAIALPAASKIYLSLQPVDMRKGCDGLAAQAQQILARDPFSGHLRPCGNPLASRAA